MAAAAVHKLQILACGVPALGRVKVTVAVNACQVGVNGRRVGLWSHVHRHLFFATGTRELGVVVTVEALLIVLR